MRGFMGQKPIVKHEKLKGHRPEGSNLFEKLAPFPNQYASHDNLFVNIQPAAPSVNNFHHCLLSSLSPGDVSRWKNLRGVLPDRAGVTFRGASRHPGPIVCGLVGTKYGPTSFHGDNLRQYTTDQFSSFVEGQVAMKNCMDIQFRVPGFLLR
jgi:hypothetical protein